MVALSCIAASAQLRLGLKAGVGLNSLKYEQKITEVVSGDNCLGFTGGLMLEWETPVVGLCLDGAVLYARRTVDLTAGDHYFRRDYLDVPLNLKFKFVVPSIASKFQPFVFTGPDFAFLVSKNKDDGMGKRFSSLSTAWNFGAGVELFRHVQLSAAYGMGLNKSVKGAWNDLLDGDVKRSVDGTDRFWTISAAVLF